MGNFKLRVEAIFFSICAQTIAYTIFTVFYHFNLCVKYHRGCLIGCMKLSHKSQIMILLKKIVTILR
jgi:hypothetical protein